MIRWHQDGYIMRSHDYRIYAFIMTADVHYGRVYIGGQMESVFIGGSREHKQRWLQSWAYAKAYGGDS